MIILTRHFYTQSTMSKRILSSTNEDIMNIADSWSFEYLSSLPQKDYTIFCSSKKRTQNTAKQLGFVEFNVSNDFDEFDLSEYDGMPQKEFMQLIKNDNAIETDFKKFKQHVADVLHNIEIEYEHSLIFTHGIFIRAALMNVFKSNLRFSDALFQIKIPPLCKVFLKNNEMLEQLWIPTCKGKKICQEN